MRVLSPLLAAIASVLRISDVVRSNTNPNRIMELMSIRTLSAVSFAVFAFTGCGDAEDADQPAQTGSATATSEASGPSGVMAIGDKRWDLIPNVQCSIYPGPIVNIAGHVKGQPDLEFVVDYGGPTGARIGKFGEPDSWHASKESISIEIDGRTVRGAGSFGHTTPNATDRIEGEFTLDC